MDYDTVRHRITTAETLLKIRPTENFNFTVAQFSIDNTAVLAPYNAVLQPAANQIRAPGGIWRVEPPRLERQRGLRL